MIQAPKREYREWKRIGRQVGFLATGEDNPRNGEGSFLRLTDGGILHAYTAYFGEDYHDHCTANVCGVWSYDEGESWSEPRLLVPMPKDALNVMSVSLLRMQSGEIGMFYLQKELYEGECIIRGKLSRSQDEGKTWLLPTDCIADLDYYVVNNDRIIRLSNGNLLFAAALHTIRQEKVTNEHISPAVAHFFLSEDDGRTFTDVGVALRSPVAGDTTGLQEPGLFELPDGTVWAYFRTKLGCQYASRSHDGGRTWSEPVPDFRFTSPRSPMLVKTVGRYTVAVFNPVPAHAYNPAPFGMDRTPLMLSVSEDGGETFVRSYLLEDDPKNCYCYPAIIEAEGGFLVSYYHSNNTQQFLNCTKIVKVAFEEIAEMP